MHDSSSSLKKTNPKALDFLAKPIGGGVDHFSESNHTIPINRPWTLNTYLVFGSAAEAAKEVLPYSEGGILATSRQAQDPRHQSVWRPIEFTLFVYELWIFLRTQSEDLIILVSCIGRV